MNNNTYKAAIYLRLSKENGAGMESDSITNQRKLIYDYVKSYPEIQICDEMIDDGFSGVNSERPEFQRLMSKIEIGNIDCVIVKDLSRLSRDYVASGNYLEKLFPSLGVRFISINDNIDSLKNDNSDSMLIPIKNIMNDAYSRDISLKIRRSFDIKRKNGEYISAHTPYGYLKSPDNRNALIVDEMAANVIKVMFYMSLCGIRCSDIAESLNAMGIPSPTEHKKQLGMNYKTAFKINENSLWSAVAIGRILQNDIYTGTLTQGKTVAPSHKIKKRIDRPEDEWVVIENAHEPIVSKTIFRIANKMYMTDTRKAIRTGNIYVLSGLALCGTCRQNMTIHMSNASKYYVCGTYKKVIGCSSHRIRVSNLEEIVLDKINEYLSNLDYKDLLVKTITDEISALLSKDPGGIFIFDEQGKIKRLTRLLLVMLVENIFVDEGKNVRIEFNSWDPITKAYSSDITTKPLLESSVSLTENDNAVLGTTISH